MRVRKGMTIHTIAKIAILVLVVVFAIDQALVLFQPSPAKAQIPVTDINLGTITLAEKIQFYFWRVVDLARAKIKLALTTASNIAFKNSLRVFAGKLAEDTANWVGSWGTGQKPLFLTDKKYFSHLFDAAAGEALDTFTVSAFGQSVCQPISLQTQLNIVAGLENLTLANPIQACQNRCQTASTDRRARIRNIEAELAQATNAENVTPPIPIPDIQCNVNEPPGGATVDSDYEWGAPGSMRPADECARILGAVILKERARDANALRLCVKDCQSGRKKASCGLQTALKNLEESQVAAEVNLALRLEENDLGQILKLYGETREQQDRRVAEERAALELGLTPQTTRVSGRIIIPRELVQKRAEIALEELTIAERTFTGTIAADLISVFTNTVISRWTERIFKGKCGLNPAACAGPGQGSGSSDFLGFLSGISAARLQFQSLGQIDYIRGDASKSLDPFTTIRSRGLTVDDRFVQAVLEQKTVREALDQGLVDGNRTFGFTSDGGEAESGYPHRLILYLRHFRIVPVGWELAAQYNKLFGHSNLSLNDLVNLYDDETVEDSTGADVPNPYYGLVDPNWVLKAPSTFCKRQGAGEEAVTRQFVCDADTSGGEPVQVNCSPKSPGGGNPDIGRWEIGRNTDYCADEQSCVVEADDGSCLHYGYCFAEKRIWKFAGTSCPNYYASCTAYKDHDGIEVAYLANTVDRNSCSADNAGCRWYCATTDAGGEWNCTEPPDPATQERRYQDRDAQTCPASASGCNEFLRTTGGANLAGNSSFEQYTGTLDDGTVDSLHGWGPVGFEAITADNPVGSNNRVAAKLVGASLQLQSPFPFSTSGGPTPDALVYYRRFTLSYYAKALGVGCSGNAALDVGGGAAVSTVSMGYGSNWSRYIVTSDPILPPAAIPFRGIQITIDGPGCEIAVDNVQLEEGLSPTTYKDYGQFGQVFLNQNAEQCRADQVGCERYRPANNGLDVAGIVTDGDRCSVENIGCTTFREMPITHIPTRSGRDPLTFVAGTGNACTVSSVGCEEYTNLEAQARGGEAREYYAFIKQCVLPSDAPAANQATYFSWVGSHSRGYELKSYRMLRSNIDDGPCTNLSVGTINTDPACEDTPATQADCTGEIDTNPDCTEYFDTNGLPYYRLRSRVITASEECYPARNTIDQELGIDTIYNISPRESVRCPAAHAGCREYRGNAGNNVRLAYRDTFEDGTVNGWDGGTPSNESASGRGFSIRLAPGGRLNQSVVTGAVSQNRTYTLSFWARPEAAGAQMNSIYFDGAPSIPFVASPIALADGWQLYTVGPALLDRPVAATEGITFNPSGAVFLDNVELREMTDSTYLIADTWRACPASEVGCSIYTNRANRQEFLKSFTALCTEDVVGCQQVIDTQNSSVAGAQTTRGVTVPADDPTPAWVVDSNDFCDAQYKGCRAFGQPTLSSDRAVLEYSTVHLIDDPDRHPAILCTEREDQCAEYTNTLDGSVTHFRNPGTRVCVYKRLAGTTDFTWVYGDTNQPCSSTELYDTCEQRDTDGDTVADAFCYTSQTDAECAASGGCATRLCEPQSSVCNEYRDPNDPEGCRAQCPLVLYQGQPLSVDERCQPLDISLGGIPGCRSYYYLKQSVENTAAECGTDVDLEAGCRPFFDTSNPTRTFRAF